MGVITDGIYLLTGHTDECLFLVDAVGRELSADHIAPDIPTSICEVLDYGAIIIVRLNDGRITSLSQQEATEAMREFSSAAFGAVNRIGFEWIDRTPRKYNMLEWTSLCTDYNCDWRGGLYATAGEAETECTAHTEASGHHAVCFLTLSRWRSKSDVGPGSTTIQGVSLPEGFCDVGVGWRVSDNGRAKGYAYCFRKDGHCDVIREHGDYMEAHVTWKACEDNHIILSNDGDEPLMLALLYVERDIIVLLPYDHEDFWLLKRVSVIQRR